MDIVYDIFTSSFKPSSANNTSAPETLPIMKNKVGLILLLIISLNPGKVQSQCTTTDFCFLRSIRGMSVYNSSMSKRSMSMTCQQACLWHSGCTATSYDSTTENCELHEAGTEGTSCMTFANDERSSFRMIKQPERSCPKVSSEKYFNVEVSFQNILLTLSGCEF